MNELVKDITARELEQISSNITEGVGKIIEQSKGSIAVYLNSKVVLTYWNIGKYIAKEIIGGTVWKGLYQNCRLKNGEDCAFV